MGAVYKIWGDGPIDSPASPTQVVSGTDTYYSQPVGVPDGKPVSFHVTFTGTPTGTLSLWYTNKPNANRANDTDWVQDSTFTPSNPAGAGVTAFYTVGNLTCKSARLKYVNAAGSGTVVAWATVGTER